MSSINDKQNKAVPIPDEVMRKIFESVSEGIMITDCRKRICHVNPAFEFVTGYPREEVIGHSPAILQSGVHGPHFYREMWEQILIDGVWQGEIWNRRKTGDVYPEWLTISEVRDEAGNVTNYCGIFSDLSERRHVETQLEQTIAMDSLTSVSNRHNYIERMQTLLAASSALTQAVKHAVYVIDIDRFKQFNDTFGHSKGDYILETVANRLKTLIKNKDIIARYGGDEFVITLTNITSMEEARAFADVILDIIRQPLPIEETEVFLNASIGIALYPHDGTTTEQLLHNADKAMTYIKATGRGGYEFYFDDLRTDVKRRIVLDAELRKAIDQKDFTLNYQPKVCAMTGQILGVEALVRWHNDKLGFVPPNEFIDHAEETGLIIPLSDVIFEMACEGYNALKRAGRQMPIAVNVSSIHFEQPDFIASLTRILDAHEVSAQNLEIEVTERTVMNDASETVDKLVRLKKLGFKLAIDDFGTGYSSLSYLIKFPLDYLKIDRSFIQQITTLDEKQAVVDAIIQMSHRLNMKVIAEGVEQDKQVELLRSMGCDIIQGYYYSKPLPLDELIEFLSFWDEHTEV
ncbi:MAG TPA: EAL domain-containing protein [Metalysinibacillus jejuensis]|uniref:EAL domain-containing protein n=1 Tax=Metalysinibacillus jejuensis TaxID=914327 RepID=A0A921NDI5_9BACL|nr:EAL domain-containing protein [Metalysinibacillus jejuensis]